MKKVRVFLFRQYFSSSPRLPSYRSFSKMNILQVILIIIAALIGALLFYTIKRKINHPEKSYLYCFLNAILAPLRLLKLGPYSTGPSDMDAFMKKATKMTKLTDFGGTDFVHGYNLLLDTKFHQSLVYSNLGYIAAQLDVIFVLVARLRKTQYIKENPTILNVPIREPVFVMGLPRTGTTFLHRLLSLDPKVRAPLLWELANSVPLAPTDASYEEKQKCRQKRCKLVKSKLKTRDFIGDDALTHIHEIGADLPEECLVAMREDMPLNLQYLMSLYMNFDYLYEKLQVKNTYVWYKKVLQMLSFQISEEEARSPRRWMLKCPVHLLYTKEIASVFPDAKIIWTHRHPVSAVPSMCSLIKACHQTYFEKECRDDHALGQQLRDVTAKWLETAPKDIEKSGLPNANVVYNDLIADPISTVKKIYDHFGWEFSKEYEHILNDFMEKDRQKREKIKRGKVTSGKSPATSPKYSSSSSFSASSGKDSNMTNIYISQKDSSNSGQDGDKLHTYLPEEFGLTEKELSEEVFATYIAKFNLPISRN